MLRVTGIAALFAYAGACSDGDKECLGFSVAALRISVIDASNEAAVCGAVIEVTRERRTSDGQRRPAFGLCRFRGQ